MPRRRSVPEGYEVGPDGLLQGIVGPWVHVKHARVRKYVDISGPTRRKYASSQSTYIDLFCGAGRAKIKDTPKRLLMAALLWLGRSR
jgi:hypothetical protein